MSFEQRARLQAVRDDLDDVIGIAIVESSEHRRYVKLTVARGASGATLTLDGDDLRRMIDNAQNAHGRT